MPQALDQAGARFSTLLYIEGDAPATDLSQYATDLQSDGTGIVYESATTRLAGTGPRTIRLRWSAQTASDEGTIWRHGSGAATETLSVAAGAVRVYVSSGYVLEWTPANYPTAGQGARIVWTTLENPDTTGAANAMRSIVTVYNESTGAIEQRQATHIRKPTTTATAYMFGASTGGFQLFDGAAGLRALGIDHGPATLTTTEHDWGTAVADTAGAAGTTERPLVPLASSSTAGAAGEFFGLVAQHAAAAHWRSRRRLLSPMVNERFPVSSTIRSSSLSTASLWSTVPDSSGYAFGVSFLRLRPMPADASHVFVRAHIEAFELAGAATVEVGLRCYSFDASPMSPALTTIRHVEARVVSGDAPAHVFESMLPVARGADGYTWLALALRFDPDGDTGPATFTAVRLRSWQVVPRHVEASDGALQFGGGE